MYSHRPELSARVMDMFLVRRIDALFRVGLAIIQLSEGRFPQEIQCTAPSYEQTTDELRCPPADCAELLISQELSAAVDHLRELDKHQLPNEAIMNTALYMDALPFDVEERLEADSASNDGYSSDPDDKHSACLVS